MQPIELPFRTEQLYGRDALLQQLRELFVPVGAARAVLLVGAGGAGKTRVIEELVDGLEAAGQLYLPLYDFYHIDRFRASAIEEAIIAAFSDQRPQAAHLFAPYHAERQRLEGTRQSGDAFDLAQRRVRDAFVRCYNQLLDAEGGRPAVLLFDSVEQASNLSDGAEQRLLSGRPGASNGGELWLSEQLPQLHNSVSLLSGRPQTLYDEPVSLYARLEQQLHCTRLDIGGMPREAADAFAQALQTTLQDATQPPEVQEYARAVILDAPTLALWHAISAGQPFWIAMLCTCHMFGATPLEVDAVQAAMVGATPPQLSPDQQERLRGAAMRHFLSEIDANDQGLLLALQWMATMRKGASAAMLRAVADQERVDLGDIDTLHQRLGQLLVVKRRRVPRYTHGGADEEETLLFLHDEMYHWLDQNLQGAVHLRPAVSRALLAWYDESIRAADQDHLVAVEQLLIVGDEHATVEALNLQRAEARRRKERLLLDRLAYSYQLDRGLGEREYNMRAYQAIIDREAGFGVMLRQEALRNHYRLDQGVPPTVEVECAARWLLRAVHNEDREQADLILGRLGPYLTQEPQLPGPHYALLHLATAHAWLRLHPDEREQGGQALEAARAALQSAPPDDHWVDLLHVYIDVWSAYFYRLAYQLFDADEHYRRALQRARRNPAATPEIISNILQNYTFMISEQGKSEEARRIGREALMLNQRYGSEYSVALSLNTLARVEIRAGQALMAREYATVAHQIFTRFQSARGLSLCLPVLAESNRKVGEQLGHAINRQEQTFARAAALYYEAHKLLTENKITSAERWREVCQGLGCTYRSWGQAIHNRGADPARAAENFSQAHQWLEKAFEVAREKQPALIKLDIQEDLSTVHVNQDEYDERIVYHLERAERLAPPEYRFVEGVGLRGTSRPVYGFFRELGQCELQRMMLGFGKYDLGLYHYDTNSGARTLIEQGKAQHLREAARHMLLMLAYLLEYAHSSPMLDRASQLALRELRNNRSEADLKLISTELYEAARRYRLSSSAAMRLAERLIDQAHTDITQPA